jgi:ferredoxin
MLQEADMIRELVVIDEEKCNGCGNCVPGCPEGALQIIDGKARLVSDLLCDGLGACIGECPAGAIKVEKKEAGVYNEEKVMANIARQGANTVRAHLKHLNSHGQKEYLNTAVKYLIKNNFNIPDYVEKEDTHMHEHHEGCPGARTIDFSANKENSDEPSGAKQASRLRQWPVQLHLVSPNAPYYQGKDLLLAADCTAFAMGSFHQDYLNGRSLAIACPKLDSEMEIYGEKITAMIDEAKVNTITVMIMQVPCCGGLLAIAKAAAGKAKRKVPIKAVVVGLKGDILQEEWVQG